MIMKNNPEVKFSSPQMNSQSRLQNQTHFHIKRCTQVCKNVFNRVSCRCFKQHNCSFAHDEQELKITKCRTNCHDPRCHFFHPQRETKQEFLLRTNLISCPGTYNPPIHLPHIRVHFPFDNVLVKILIGTDGSHFKRITEKSGCSFLWYDKKTRVVEIWGVNGHYIHKGEVFLMNHCLHMIQKIMMNNPSQISDETLKWHDKTIFEGTPFDHIE